MIINRLYYVVSKFFLIKHIVVGLVLGLCLNSSLSAQEYQGYRVFVSNMSITKVKPGYTLVQTTIINTGREVFKLTPALSDKIIIKYDRSIGKVLAQLDSLDVINAIFESGLTLAPGKMKAIEDLKIFPTPTKVMVNSTETLAEDNKALANAQIDQEQISVPKKTKKKKEKTNSPEPTIEKTSTPVVANPEDLATGLPDAAKEIETTVKEPTLAEVKKQKTKKEKKQKKKQKEISSSAKEMAETAATKATEQSKSKEINVQEVLEETVDESMVNNEPGTDEVMLVEEEEEGCSDLILEELSVIKKTKNSVQLAYTIRNIGQGRVFIGAKKKEEGIAIRGHLSSSEHLSRGALTVGGDFLSVNDEQATLSPGQSFSGSMKLPMYKLTKFTPYLILQIDPYQKVLECDETNNLNFINLVPDSPLSKPSDHQ